MHLQSVANPTQTRPAARAAKHQPLPLARLSDIAHAALESKKVEDLVSLTLPYGAPAHTLLIGTATSDRHASTLADAVEKALLEHGEKPLGREGDGTDWVLLDYGIIVVHVFLADSRKLYRLEKLWAPVFADSEPAAVA